MFGVQSCSRAGNCEIYRMHGRSPVTSESRILSLYGGKCEFSDGKGAKAPILTPGSPTRPSFCARAWKHPLVVPPRISAMYGALLQQPLSSGSSVSWREHGLQWFVHMIPCALPINLGHPIDGYIGGLCGKTWLALTTGTFISLG